MQTNSFRYTTHPMLLIAAVAVVLFCTVGIAAMMGWLPDSFGSGAPRTPGDSYAAYSAGRPMGPPVASDVPVQLASRDTVPGSLPAAAPVMAAAAPAYAPAAAPAPAYAGAPASTACHSCGEVVSVRTITTRGRGTGAGAAGGAILGGILGHQIGAGRGRDLATVAGAVGGAVVGNQVEGNMKASHSYEVRVRLDDGKTRTFHTTTPWRNGDQVRIVKGQLQHR